MTSTDAAAGLRDPDDADLLPSPGISTKAATIFLAEGLHAGDTSPDASSEETDLQTRWVPLADVLADIRVGRITDAMAVAGLQATAFRPH